MPLFRILNGSILELEGSTCSHIIEQLYKTFDYTTETHYFKIIEPITGEELKNTDKITRDEYFVFVDKFFLDWINLSKLDIWMLHFNPHPKAIEYFKANPSKINWKVLSRNPLAIDLLLDNLSLVTNDIFSNPHPKAIQLFDQLYANQFKHSPYRALQWKPYRTLELNSGAVDLFKKYPNQFNWSDIVHHNKNLDILPLVIEKWKNDKVISDDDMKSSFLRVFEHPEAVPYLIEHPSIRPWDILHKNPHPLVFEWIKDRGNPPSNFIICNTNIDALRWALDIKEFRNKVANTPILFGGLYTNPSFLTIMNDYPELIQTTEQLELLFNINDPRIIPYAEKAYKNNMIVLRKCYDGGSFVISKNPIMISLLEKYPELVCYSPLSSNPGIFS